MSRKPSIEKKSVREIFTAAMMCSSSEERAGVLEAECGDDVDLRRRVEDLLNESSRVGDFLERPAVSETTMVDRWSGGPLPAGESVGDHIGPYRLVELVGEGGGGSVYRAEQGSPVQRTVALKILKLGMDTRSVIARFESERQSLAVMDHPNIARVLEAGASPDGRPYFVMDFVEGEPITDYCDAKVLTVGERVAIFIKVCRAVEHAHQKGIIHRDIKPTNILVTEQDGHPEPKVIDFGVAKAVEPVGDDALTMVETIIGTPAYMSPEQAERGRVDVDTRSDVYSLGVLLYELLTSDTPIDRAKLTRGGIEALRAAFREADPYRPSACLRHSRVEDRPRISIDRSTPIEKLMAELRGDLDWIVMKCLDHDRARRFGSASELAADLERYLDGAPVMARPPSAGYRMGKFVSRHRATVAAGALFVSMLIGGAAVSTVLALRATRAEQDIRKAHQLELRLRSVAERDREAALQSAATARLHEYVADINVSHHALADGHIAKALGLLERQVREPGEQDLRGFEWRYLAGRCLGDPHRSLPSLNSPIMSMDFSADGDYLAVGSREEVEVWDLRSDRRVFSAPAEPTAVAMFPDGERLAVGSWGEVRIYDLDSGDSILELGDHGGGLAISADGRYLAATNDQGVTIWSTDDWTPWRTLDRCHAPLAFSPDGKMLATGTDDGITLWPIGETGKRVVLEDSATPLRGWFPGGRRVVFTPDGSHIIAPDTERSTGGVYYIGIWEVATGREAGVLAGVSGDEGHTGMISSLQVRDGTSLVASSSWDHSVRLWDYGTQQLVRPLYGHRGEVWAVALSPGGDLVASGSKNGEVKIWPTETTRSNPSIEGRWTPLSFSSDSAYVGAVNREGLVSIFNVNTRETVHSIELSADRRGFRRNPVSLASDLTVMAEGFEDGTVRVSRLDQETEMVLAVADRRVQSVILSPDAESMVTVGWRDELAWWDLDHPETPIGRLSAMYAVYSEDGRTLAAVTREGHAIVWDTGTREERSRIAHGGQSFGSRAALSPDGRMIALTHGFADFENVISLWDTASGKRIGTMTGHKQGIWSMAFSPDGKTLATSSSDGTLRLWNVASRRELLAIDGAGSNLTNLRFSPDGRLLVGESPSFGTAGRTGELRLIHAPDIDFNESSAEVYP